MKYNILKSDSIEKMLILVNAALEEGYICLGGVQAAVNNDTYDDSGTILTETSTIFYQTIMKD